jgi:hypothetical protein
LAVRVEPPRALHSLTVDDVELLVSTVVSILVALALWAVLPRGVVLTRRIRAQDWKGEPLFDTWEIRNESPLPVTLIAATYSSAMTYHEDSAMRERVLPGWLPPDQEAGIGVSLAYDDEVLEISREEWQRPWRGQCLRPGDALVAVVKNNCTLKVQYRRAGLFGVFERRTVTIDGAP